MLLISARKRADAAMQFCRANMAGGGLLEVAQDYCATLETALKSGAHEGLVDFAESFGF